MVGAKSVYWPSPSSRVLSPDAATAACGQRADGAFPEGSGNLHTLEAPSQDRYFPLWPQAAPTQPLAYVLTFPHMNEEPVPISCNFREHISVYLCRTGREKVSKSSHTSANQSPQLSCTPSKSGMGLLAAELVFLPLHCEVCESVVLQPGNESGPSAALP